MSNGKIVLDDSAVEFLQEEVGGGSTVVANPELVGDEDDLTGLEVDGIKYKVPEGGGGIEYISVSTSGGNVTVEQLRKVFDTGNWLPLNAFFVCNGQILVFVGTTSDETELVFTSNIQYGGTYYEMVLSSKRLDYTITTKTISNIS